jgi:hypothetical protein
MMQPLIRSFLLTLGLLLAGEATGAAAPLRDFDAGSTQTIKAAHAGQAFVLVFWSIHCAPCLQEMGQWSGLQRRFPDVPIILVSTDRREERGKVLSTLARFDVRGVQTWAFADDFEERVRYSIDPTWRGELPRTYLYDRSHQAQARSGLTEATWLSPWLASQSRRVEGRR